MFRAASLAALSLLAAVVVACGGSAASGEADPASAAPAERHGVHRGRGAARGRDARRRAGRGGQGPGDRRPRGQDPRVPRQGDGRGGRRHRGPRLRQGHQALARRARRRVVQQQARRRGRSRRGRAGRRHRLRSRAGRRPQGLLEQRREAHQALVQRHRLRGRRGRHGDRHRRRRLPRRRPGGHLQDHGRRAEGQLARRVRPLQEGAREPRREPARALLRRPQAGARARELAEHRAGPGGPAADPEGHPVRQARRADGLVLGGRRPSGARHGGQDARAAASLGALGNLYSTASTPLLKELPGDTWAAFGSPKYGAVDQGGARPVRRPVRRSGRPRAAQEPAAASTSTRTS